jgi:hypothetical protein
MDHIGIDLHKKDSQICILGAEGELIEQRVAPHPRRSPMSSATAPGPASFSRRQRRASG